MNNKKLIPTILAVVFIAVVWQFISMLVGFPAIFPSVIDLLKQVVLLFGSNNFLITLGSTVLRGVLGFILAFVMAFGLSAISAFSPFWISFFHPIIVVTRSIPVISFVLLAILWISPTELPVFIALLTMFPILYQNILTGLEQTDRKWVEMAQVFGKSFCSRFIHIYLPASKSNIYDGISTAMGFGWRAIIIGEALAQPLHGIGSAMKQAQTFINVSELIAWTVVAILISYLFDSIIKQIRRIRFRKTNNNQDKYGYKLNKQNTEIKRIEITDLDKKFNDLIVFNSFHLSLNSGSVTCIKGPSGKGKTTLLRLISRIEKTKAGSVEYEANLRIAYAFQDIRLLPWLTVSENIAFVRYKKKISKQEISNLIVFLLEKLELTEQANKFPHELSGGQQQRVGLARALAANSDILLLDEPLTGLDNELKGKIIQFLDEWISTYRPLVVWATHENIQLSKSEVSNVNL